MTLHTVTCKVNGRVIALNVEARQNLAEHCAASGPPDASRRARRLAPARYCRRTAVRGCLLLAVQAEAAEIDHRGCFAAVRLQVDLQTACRHHALQCGFCTPGWFCATNCSRAIRRPTKRRLRGDFRQSLPLHRSVTVAAALHHADPTDKIQRSTKNGSACRLAEGKDVLRAKTSCRCGRSDVDQDGLERLQPDGCSRRPAITQSTQARL
jgi:carbon-monoxide dehydrogenase small subunit